MHNWSVSDVRLSFSKQKIKQRNEDIFDVEVNKMRVGRWQSLGTEPQTPGLELPALWSQSCDQTTTRNATIFDTCWQVVLNVLLTHPAATHLPPIHIITTFYFQDVKHLLKSFKNEIQYITSPMKLSDQSMDCYHGYTRTHQCIPFDLTPTHTPTPTHTHTPWHLKCIFYHQRLAYLYNALQ